MSKLIWGSGKNIEKMSVVWNMFFGIFSAVQSAVMVMIVTWTAGAEQAGIVSIAFAVGYLMFTIAAYGVRTFHASDVKRIYSFAEYSVVRLTTCLAAVVFTLFYCIARNYNSEKIWCVSCICLLKFSEALEDLCHGELQREGRLDVACRIGTIRLLANYFLLLWLLRAGVSFLHALLKVSVQSMIVVMLEFFLLKGVKREQHFKVYITKCVKILKECFPLFLMGFLNIYICNAPKYAIDSCMVQEAQAYFAVLFMPVFSINLLSGMTYRPQLVQLAEMHRLGTAGAGRFWKVIKRKSLLILEITIAMCIGGMSLGITILEMLYALPVKKYVVSFIILLAGGGMNALINFYSACLTIMRRHVVMIKAASVSAIEAVFISHRMVEHGGIMGAAVLYFVLMASQLMILLTAIIKDGRNAGEKCRQKRMC